MAGGRSCSSADAVAPGEHETPQDASSQWVRVARRADAGRRPGVAVGLLRGRHGDRCGREGPAGLRLLRRPSRCPARASSWRWPPTPGTPTTISAGRTSTPAAPTSPCSGRWRRGTCTSRPGKGRRVTGTGAPDPQNAAHVGYIQINHLSGYAGSAGWPDWELPFIEWAEREGFEIGVCTNADLEEHPEVLDGASLYLSVGHDEYWSKGMRDTVEAFIAGGGNAAFFSGNTSLWQVRIEGDDHDVMVGYKAFFKNDPLLGTEREAEVTTFWSDVVVSRPENAMTGVSFTRGGYHRIGRNVTSGLGGYTVHRAGHWIFDGTGLGYGDVLGAAATVVGYECDGCVFTYRDGLPYPTGEDGTPLDLRDPRYVPDPALHPRDGAAPAEAGRAERAGVHRVTDLRDAGARGDGTDPPRARRAGRLHERRRCDGAHLGLDRLGARAGGA